MMATKNMSGQKKMAVPKPGSGSGNGKDDRSQIEMSAIKSGDGEKPATGKERVGRSHHHRLINSYIATTTVAVVVFLFSH